jgi:hypothetical protein
MAEHYLRPTAERTLWNSALAWIKATDAHRVFRNLIHGIREAVSLVRRRLMHD